LNFPVPQPGLVIRYNFLWSNEKDAGADEAAKDRPCAIVVAQLTANKGVRTLVAPITHTEPTDPADSIEIPQAVAQALGLDGERHWVRLDELNLFSWPGFDLRPIPGKHGKFDYGMLPNQLTTDILTGIKALHSAKNGRTQTRD
jgi:hypothetical protein